MSNKAYPRVVFGNAQTLKQWKSSLKKVRLLLIVYDTAAFERINAGYAEVHSERFKLSLPEKYAVRWHQGWDDDGIVAQDLLYNQEQNAKAEWFKHFRDLPFAVQALREKFPDVAIPPQISYVIDWPMDRTKLAPGFSRLINGAVVT